MDPSRFIAIALIGAACNTVVAAPRSSAAKLEFQRANPCPATGQSRGACPGYVIDHVQPLCAGGADAPSNLQWQTAGEAKVKDRAEVAQCRRKR